MSECDAGNGCKISCPGSCAARWDSDLGVCERRCLGAAANIRPMNLGSRFSLSLSCENGRQVMALFQQYIPRELASLMNENDEPIQLHLIEATVDDLIDALYNAIGRLMTP